MKKWCLVILTLMLCGCSTAPKTAETEAVKYDRPVLRAEAGSNEKNFTVFAMDTVMQFQLYGGNDEVEEKVREKIEELEDALSVTKENSPMWELNEKKEAKFAPEIAKQMEKTLELCKDTDGALDISAYPVVKAWGFTTGEYRIPNEEERKVLAACVDYHKIQINGDTVTIAPDMLVDLGSVGKGYTAEVLAKLMKEKGVTSALFSLGGNIQTIGTKTDGTDWFIGIRAAEENRYLGGVFVKDKAVVTSGGYERYFAGDDGQIYWHIMDPKTGAPAKNGLVSVTIISDSGFLCDGLSTALFVMGVEKAASHWRSHQNYEAVLEDENGQIYITEGLENTFKPVDLGTEQEIQVIRR